MNLLSLDTSTEVLSIFGSAGSKTVELTRDIDLRHSEQLIPLTDWVLRQLSLRPKDLDLVVVAGGPGSFTGLRIGMAFAKGLTASIGCPHVTVSALDAYAARFNSVCDSIIAPVIDAKKHRFYTALWKGHQRVTEYLDIGPEEFQQLIPKDQPCILTGPHALLLKNSLSQDTCLLDPSYRCGIAHLLATLGLEKFQSAGPAKEDDGPLYVRKSDAEIAKNGL